MSDTLVFFVGNRNPSITENIVDDQGAAVDLTAATVKFKAREVGSATMIVDAVAAIVAPATAGNVRYDWSAADILPAGALGAERQLLVWWEVTAGGKTQDVQEAIVYVDAHAPDAAYVEVEELKKTIEVTRNFADQDIRGCLIAASRAIEKRCGRRSFSPAAADSVRFYSARHWRLLIDDLYSVTEVATDGDGDGTYSEVWTENVDYVFEPENAAADSWPFEALCYHPSSGKRPWPFAYPRSVRVTGKFGWPAVPEAIKTGTSMLAVRLLRIKREAPLGVIALGVDGEAVRISRSDPGLAEVLNRYIRTQVLA